MLPKFIVIGAQRSGTTSLYKYVTQHPNILSAISKEVHFFDQHYNKGLAWYKAHFPTVFRKFQTTLKTKKRTITGEASPYYIFHPHACLRIKKYVPKAKFIIILRNPIDRAYSHYNLSKFRKLEKLSFEEAIEAEADRLKGEEAKMAKDPQYFSHNHSHFSYASRGFYIDQIKKWLEIFKSEQFLVLNSEQFYADSEQTLNLVFEFLGVQSYKVSDTKIHKIGETYKPMKKKVRKKLAKLFDEPNKELYEMLGVDFNWK